MTPFEVPHFTFWTVVYTSLGAAFFWNRAGRTKLKVYVLSALFDAFDFPVNKWRALTEFLLFISFGILIGIGLTSPRTVAQALTAGFAWTSFVAKKA